MKSPAKASRGDRAVSLPKTVSRFRVNDFLAVRRLIESGLGVGILPTFLEHSSEHLLHLTGILDERQTELWLLTHPETRHLLHENGILISRFLVKQRHLLMSPPS